MATITEKFRTRALAVTVVAVAGLALSGCSLLNQITNGTDRDDDGNVTNPNDDADVFSILVGDCLNDADSSGAVTTAPIVLCDEPHDSEAYASIQLDDGDYPGDTTVSDAADSLCYDAFEPFVGVASENSKYDFTYYVPTERGWNERDDREVLCTIFDPDGRTTGSLKGVGE